MKPSDRLARLHFVNTLLHSLTGQDLFLAAQVLDAVEEATSVVPAIHDDPVAFTAVVEYLHEALTGAPPEAGFTYLDGAAAGAPGPLWLRAGLRDALERHGARRQATVMVANLDPAPIVAPAAARPRRRQLRDDSHADNVAQLRAIAAREANPQSLVTLLFV